MQQHTKKEVKMEKKNNFNKNAKSKCNSTQKGGANVKNKPKI